MKPSFRVELRAEKFSKNDVACLGRHLESLLLLVKEVYGDVDVYGADQYSPVIGPLETREPQKPSYIGRVSEVLVSIPLEEQFESGVYWACSPEVMLDLPVERSLAFTDDDKFVDFGNAFVEIRMFDYEYIEIYAVCQKFLEILLKKYNIARSEIETP